MINSTHHIDYATTGYSCCDKHSKAEISIKNKGDVAAPFSLSAYNEEGDVLEKVWVGSIDKGKDSIITMQSQDVVAYKIDGDQPK